MIDRLAVGLIGAGVWGERYLEKLVGIPSVGPVGLYDADSKRLDEMCRRYGVRALPPEPARWEGVAAAFVVTSTAAHYEIARACLDAGIHVLVEKPFTSTVEEAEDLVRKVKECGRICQVGHIERFSGAWSILEERLARPMYMEGQRLAPFRERGTDVDVVLDLMIHDVDLVVRAAGAEPVRVDAVGVPVLSREVDMVNVRLEFESGLVANLTASRVSPDTVRKLRVFQEDGYFSADFLSGTIRHCMVGPMVEEKKIYEERVGPGERDPLLLQILDFVECVRLGRPPRVAAEDGLRALRTAHRIKSSVRKFLERVG